MQRDQLLAGRYRLLERLGSGGMSAVHRAYDEVLERDVAVKVLVATHHNARQRIRAEAKAAARLSHPHVTSVYDFGESLVDGAQVPFVVMEMLGGHTLEQRLASGPLPPRAGLRVCAQVASALAAAHDQDLVHRDIKPGNVMLTPAGAKVLDFGIAAAAGESEIDFEGRLLGTPAYLAPERLEAGEVLPACDVYALGLLLHRVLTGRLPWPAEAQTGMLRAHTHVEPDPLPRVDGVPPEVHRLYRWCLARDPVDRPPAVEAARILLAAAAASAATAVVEAAGAVDPAADATEQPGDTPADASEPTGPKVETAGPTGETGEAAAGSTSRRGAWRRGRAVLAVSCAVIAAVAIAGSLGDSHNRRLGQKGPSTGIGPGTTTVGMPRSEEPADTGPAAVPPAGSTAPASRSAPRARPSPTVTTPGPTPTRAAHTPTPTPGSGASVDARGGTVTIRCVGKSVEVLAVTLVPGFRVEAYDPGPAKQIQVELVSSEHRSEVRVRCPGGSPKSRVRERAV
ncbi:serine/threonine-protein kinase [Micromonospora zamorensis]|uniref:serine/threonine-protein kinase n=1 Tax=Micromonospora zamorensis TaxID=709883 RepID=UPI00081FE346|nr:serine/threonine-protein kinase [Micromonospora zamorensis]SCG66043.1 serine/threonine protein kinase [Micromonospora zamorensis]